MSTVPSGVHPVVILGNSRRRSEEISEFIDLYPDKGDQCGGEIKPYEKGFDEHVESGSVSGWLFALSWSALPEGSQDIQGYFWTKSYSSIIFGF